jgi:hypothetical protein
MVLLMAHLTRQLARAQRKYGGCPQVLFRKSVLIRVHLWLSMVTSDAVDFSGSCAMFYSL